MTPARSDLLDRVVVVDGVGALTAAVTQLLRAEGVRWVEAGPWAADSTDAELRHGTGRTPDLVVLVRGGRVDPRAGEPWRRRGVAHLPVTSSPARVRVGPWLTGDPDQPCLGCLVPGPVDAGGVAGASLLATGAAMAAMVVMAGLAGRALPSGVSAEVHGPWPRVDHRRWSRDLECPWHEPRDGERARRSGSADASGEDAAGPVGGGATQATGPRVTMTR